MMKKMTHVALATTLLLAAERVCMGSAKEDESLREEVKGLSSIVFARYTEENWDIWKVNPDGSGLTRLTTDPARDIYPKWSRDGRQIVFQSDRGAPPMPAAYPKWQWLRETISASAHDKEYGIYLMNADGTNVTKVWQGGKTPSLSPDSKAVVFSSDGQLWVKAIGNDEPPWAITPKEWGWAALPDWRGDGRQIVCLGMMKKAPEPIVIDMDPKTYRPVTLEGHDKSWRMIYLEEGYDWHGCNPEYSPDGKLITHTFDVDGSQISIVGVDGKNPARRKFHPLKGWNHCGDFSPDGKYIVFAHADGGDHPARANIPLRVWITDLEGKRAFQVVKEEGMCRDPDWSPAAVEANPEPAKKERGK